MTEPVTLTCGPPSMLTPVCPDSDRDPPACKEMSESDLMLTPCAPWIVTVPDESIVTAVCVWSSVIVTLSSPVLSRICVAESSSQNTRRWLARDTSARCFTAPLPPSTRSSTSGGASTPL